MTNGTKPARSGMRWMVSLLAATISATGAAASPWSKDALEGHAQYGSERYAEAVQAYERAIAAGERDPSVLYNLGNARYRAAEGDTSLVRGALEEWQRAAASAGDELRPRSLYNAGTANLRLGDLERAARLYEDVLRQDPNDEDARYNLELVQRWMAQNPPSSGGESDSSKANSQAPPDSSQSPSEEQGGEGPGNNESAEERSNPSEPSENPRETPQETPSENPAPDQAQGEAPGEGAPEAGETGPAGGREVEPVSVDEALRQLEKLEEAEREHLRELLLAKRREMDVEKDW